MSAHPSNVISLVLADDHALIRSAVLEMLSPEKGLRIVAAVADGVAALEAIRSHRPQVAVLDVEMPGWTGLEVARAAREQGLATSIVFLTMHKDPHIVRTAVELGVSGYVLKDSLDQDLMLAIQAAAEKKTFFSARVAPPLPLSAL